MSSISKDFSDSIIRNEIKENAQEYTELALDQIIDNEIIKEIPIIKTILSFYKVGVGIKERYTIKKILRFLTQLNGVSSDEKEAFINDLSTDQKYREEIFERLLVILDKLDDLEKSEIIGRLFKAAILTAIDLETFFKLCLIIEKSFIKDIKYFCLKHRTYRLNDQKETDFIMQYYESYNEKELSSLGLLLETIVEDTLAMGRERHKTMKYKFQYKASHLGIALVNHAY